jgi:hypothetical protein
LLSYLNIRFLLTLLVLSLSGCGTGDLAAQIPPQTAYVRVSNGGSLFGSSSAYVYAGDVAVFRAQSGGTDERVSMVTLRTGAYGRIRAAAVGYARAIEGQSAQEPLCLDYGVDVIEVHDGVQPQASVSAGCPVEDLVAAQAALRRMIQEEIAQ